MRWKYIYLQIMNRCIKAFNKPVKLHLEEFRKILNIERIKNNQIFQKELVVFSAKSFLFAHIKFEKEYKKNIKMLNL